MQKEDLGHFHSREGKDIHGDGPELPIFVLPSSSDTHCFSPTLVQIHSCKAGAVESMLPFVHAC